MPTPEPPQKAEKTDVPERVGAVGSDPWEQMPEDALNRPNLQGADDGAPGIGADTGGAARPDGASPAGDADEASGEDPGRAPSESWTDFLPSPLFVLLLGLTGFAGWMSWQAVELEWAADGTSVTPLVPPLLILLGWIASLAVHEFAHALAAYLAGDRSLRGSAYLRLNPFAYRQAFAGLVLPSVYLCLGAFGLTGPPTYVDWDRIPSRGRRVLVALAGPLASLLLAAALAVAVSVLVPPGNDTTNWAISAMALLCFSNLTAALVNLLPVPGLDGFEVLAAWTRGTWVTTARVNALFGSVAVFAVLWFPGLNDALVNLVYSLFELVLPNPVFSGIAFYGELLLQFWV
ncbi:Zn-dependent protease [Nocardiopsis arvandica]|uniref:Zn-dependent protease n=1 Tax=Nocardiopsis sinuspersici TaxID=501010 RepID=A0A7Y9X9S6_9ACTN|nr:site-2 protease family protein [Nocardiopsis sinuspersici]NYH51862.1 Zn-dependent protease [Nocardiopsis sinuspersici]